MTTEKSSDTPEGSTPSRSEIESALQGRTKYVHQKPLRPTPSNVNLSEPPRRPNVIGGNLSGVSKRHKFSIFSRHSDISIANWVAIAIITSILVVFFWPNTNESTQEIESPDAPVQSTLGETDLSNAEQADLLQSEIESAESSFSRTSDLDRANAFRAQDLEDKQIRALLDQAKGYVLSGSYTKPSDANAIANYEQILLINPNNVAAKQGISFIKNRFLELGMIELQEDQLQKSQQMLQNLASISPGSDEYDELLKAIGNWKIQDQINSFNKLGRQAFIQQNLLLPANQSAQYFYKQALELNGADETALAGIENITTSFVEQTQKAITAGELQTAAAHLLTLGIIAPDNASITTLRSSLNRALLLEERLNNPPEIASTEPQSSLTARQEQSEKAPTRQTLEQQTFDKQYLKQGLEAYRSGDYEKSAALLQPLADKGIARAKFRLAYMHYLGRGFEKNTDKAESIISAALPAITTFANENRAWAQSDLGSLYEDGLVLKRDYSMAVKWYRAAAEQGHPSAQTNLGSMYAGGRGVDTNKEAAIKWFLKAANQGDLVAKRNLIAMGVTL